MKGIKKKDLLCAVDALADGGATVIEVEAIVTKMVKVGIPYLAARSTIDIVNVGAKQIMHPKNYKQNKRELANCLKKDVRKALELANWHW